MPTIIDQSLWDVDLASYVATVCTTLAHFGERNAFRKRNTTFINDWIKILDKECQVDKFRLNFDNFFRELEMQMVRICHQWKDT